MNSFLSSLKLQLLLILVTIQVQAQALQTSTTQLVFGATFETQTDSLPLVLINPSLETIQVSAVFMAPVYGEMPFSCQDTSVLLPSSDSITLWIRFRPRHNILNNAELILRTCTQGNCYTGFNRIDLRGQGRYSLSYYNSTENLSEQPLKNALKTRISSPYTSQSYNAARDFMFMTLDNKAVNGQGALVNTLTCVYTGRTITGYSSRTQAQNSPYNFNTEHTWPQSLFNENLPMRSDLFHLFPTDIAANGSRANYAFGNPTTPYQSVSINAPSILGSNNLYQPRTAQRAGTARAMMYFILRYQNYSNFFTSQESILRDWHTQFPPDSIERKRCQDISTFQSNRNPFIDYPQFIERIASLSAVTSTASAQYQIQTPGNIHFAKVYPDSVYEVFYPIVNTGNVAINLSNFQLSHPNLSFFAGGSSVNLDPGDAHEVGIRYSVSTSPIFSQELFSFTRTGSASPTNVVIQASAALGFKEDLRTPSITLFPNPTHGLIYLKTNQNITSTTYRIIDLQGRIKFEEDLNKHLDEAELNISHLPPGLYFIEISKENYLIFRSRIYRY